jgi:hypothetical protein
MLATGGPVQWIESLLKSGPEKEKKKNLGILFTFWWFIWKDRNNRFFEDKHKPFRALASLIQDEVRLIMLKFPEED